MFHRPRKGSVLVVGTPFPHPTILTCCLWGVLVLASHVNGSYAVWPFVSQAFPESFGSQSCPIKNHCFRHKAVPGKASSSGVWVALRGEGWWRPGVLGCLVQVTGVPCSMSGMISGGHNPLGTPGSSPSQNDLASLIQA